MLAGTAATAGGMYWFSCISVHSTYVGGLLGPSLVTSAGLGLLFVPLALVALTRVRDQDCGLASSLLSTGQQVGGAIGLAALGTVVWTGVASSAHSQIAAAAAVAARSGRSLAAPRAGASIYHDALAAGIDRGFLAASGIALAALVTAVVAIRVRHEAPANPAAAGPGQLAGAGRRPSQPARNGRSRGRRLDAAHPRKEYLHEHAEPRQPRPGPDPRRSRLAEAARQLDHGPRLPGPCPARPGHDRPEVAADPRW